MCPGRGFVSQGPTSQHQIDIGALLESSSVLSDDVFDSPQLNCFELEAMDWLDEVADDLAVQNVEWAAPANSRMPSANSDSTNILPASTQAARPVEEQLQQQTVKAEPYCAMEPAQQQEPQPELTCMRRRLAVQPALSLPQPKPQLTPPREGADYEQCQKLALLQRYYELTALLKRKKGQPPSCQGIIQPVQTKVEFRPSRQTSGSSSLQQQLGHNAAATTAGTLSAGMQSPQLRPTLKRCRQDEHPAEQLPLPPGSRVAYIPVLDSCTAAAVLARESHAACQAAPTVQRVVQLWQQISSAGTAAGDSNTWLTEAAAASDAAEACIPPPTSLLPSPHNSVLASLPCAGDRASGLSGCRSGGRSAEVSMGSHEGAGGSACWGLQEERSCLVAGDAMRKTPTAGQLGPIEVQKYISCLEQEVVALRAEVSILDRILRQWARQGYVPVDQADSHLSWGSRAVHAVHDGSTSFRART